MDRDRTARGRRGRSEDRDRTARGRDSAGAGSYGRSEPRPAANRRGRTDEGSRTRSDGGRPDRQRRGPGRARDAALSHGQETAPPRPGLQRRPDEPAAPEGVNLRSLPIAIRAELKGLPTELAERVGAHLIAAGELIDSDPEAALAHAHAARRRAARLTVTREALAETAYAAGDWSTALNEFRALRRMTGDQMWLPAMADCERALGRPQAALRLVKESQALNLRPTDRVEVRLVEAGARADLGQRAEASRLLRATLAALPARAVGSRVRVGYALADLLLQEGQHDAAARQFAEVADWDTDGATDAAERRDELNGLVLDLGDDVDDDPAGGADPASADPAGDDRADDDPAGDDPAGDDPTDDPPTHDVAHPDPEENPH